MYPLFVIPAPAFEIQGRGTVLLTGVSARGTCPLKTGDRILIRLPNGLTGRAVVKAIEYVLLSSKEEQFGVVLSSSEIPTADIATGTQVFFEADVSFQPSASGIANSSDGISIPP